MRFLSKAKLHPTRIELEGRLIHAVVTNSHHICALLKITSTRSIRLVCFNTDGTRRWQRDLNDITQWNCSLSLRLAPDGILWLGLDNQLHAFDEAGQQLSVLSPDLEPRECLGSFLVRPDGFYVSIYQSDYQTEDGPPEELSPRVAWLDSVGAPKWSTTLPMELHQFAGIVEMSADNGWKAQPKPAWRPQSWTADFYVRDPLLLSGNRLLASFIDISSGLGVSYCLDAITGEFRWNTPNLPFSRHAIAGYEKFLFGVGGYGMSLTQLRDGDGAILQEWEQNGVMCVRPSSEIVLVEEFDRPPHVWTLHPNGEARQGAEVTGCYSTQPVLTRDGQLVFWRDGKLCCVGRDLKLHVLYAAPELQSYTVPYTMLLCPDGTLVFGIYESQGRDSQLWFVPSHFELEEKSPWPCANGNMAANPCWSPAL